MLWTSYFGLLKEHFGDFGLLRDHFGECAVKELLWATQGSLWPVCCERAIWATQGSLWPVCCGRDTLSYSGITLASVLWKRYLGLLRDHFGQCAVKELVRATQGSLWWKG